MEWESIPGLIRDNTMVNGLIIKCMEEEFSHGLTVESTMESIMMTKSKDMEYLLGQMVADMRDIGKMENNTAKVYIIQQRVKPNVENGKKAKELDGLQKQLIMMKVLRHCSNELVERIIYLLNIKFRKNFPSIQLFWLDGVLGFWVFGVLGFRFGRQHVKTCLTDLHTEQDIFF